tara:strand:+ start:78530 stop:79987 length:1458 start_codon:yes stop_codon:yes gene_type:complete
MKKQLFLLVFTLAIHGYVNGQFSRYWNESFSTKAALLSGAVVGGYSDETSIYYNPSILNDSNMNSLSFSNGLMKIDLVRYENAMGDGLGVSNWESSVASGFLSVGLYPKDNLGLIWKAAVFNKSKFDNSFKGEFRSEDDIFLQAPGKEKYYGSISSRTEYNDYWYGVGISKRNKGKFTIGASFFLRYSSLRYNASKRVEVAPYDSNSILENVSLNNISEEFRGYVWRATMKLGLNYKLNKQIKLGLVITTPSIAVVGSADVHSNISYLNIVSKKLAQFLPDVIADEAIASADFNIKDPLSLALGIDYTFQKTRWNVTLEWFSKLKPYRLIDGRTGEKANTNTANIVIPEDFLSYKAGGNGLLNLAVGLEVFTKNDRSWLFGVKTDFDALNNFNYEDLESLNTLVNAKTDYYHISAGKNFQFLNYDVLLGLEYSLSRASNLKSFANFSPPIFVDDSNPYNLEGVIENTMNFKGDALVLFIGLTFKK